jgi:hypothetical protein
MVYPAKGVISIFPAIAHTTPTQAARAGDMPFGVVLGKPHIDNHPPGLSYFVHHELRIDYYIFHVTLL